MPLLVAVCLLPYFAFTPMATDTQPYALVVLLLFLIAHSLRTGSLPLHPITVLASVFLLVFGLPSGEIVQTVSLAMLPITIDFLSRQRSGAVVSGAKIAVVVLLVGLVLNLVAENLLEIAVSNYRSSESRGFNSFASEPSFLGLVGLSCALIFHVLRAKMVWFLAAILITLSSGSGAAIFPLGLFLAAIFLRGRRILLLPLLLLAFWWGLNYAASFENRFGSVATLLVDTPSLILTDVSFSNRLIRSLGPIYVAFENGFVPHGLSISWDVAIGGLSDEADDKVTRLSSLGSVLLYGLGFLSIPLVYLYLTRARGSLAVWTMIAYFSMANISIATPYLWLVLSIPVLLKRQSGFVHDGSRDVVLMDTASNKGSLRALGTQH